MFWTLIESLIPFSILYRNQDLRSSILYPTLYTVYPKPTLYFFLPVPPAARRESGRRGRGKERWGGVRDSGTQGTQYAIGVSPCSPSPLPVPSLDGG